MTRLRFKYYMRLSFSDSVEKHRFSLKCVPKTDATQRILLTRKDVYPNSFISEGMDSFGNLIIYGYEEKEHKDFFFDVEGEAQTGLAHGLTDSDISIFKYQTEVTRPGDCLYSYYSDLTEKYLTESIKYADASVYDTADDSMRFALYTMSRLGNDYEYVCGVTDIQTKAEEAMKSGKGVCQDYAHIMISVCRMKKIPSRYVTGMMLGEGKSHAWVEVYSGNKWIGIDPTNKKLVDDYYIKIAHGRDYSDCLVNQGVFTGHVTQQQEISVLVEEVD